MRRKISKNQVPSHHLIVENGDWSAVLEARKNGVPWDSLRTRTGLSALGMAIFEGSPLATQTLLESGAPIQSEQLYDGSLFSPLWKALENNNPEILDVLLQAGADPNEEHPDYGAPILYASQNAMKEATIILCQNGSIPNTETAPSPLWLWIKNLTPQQDPETKEWTFGDSTPITKLLKSGARIHSDDEDPDHPSMGMNEIDFANRQWLKHPLKPSDLQNVKMTLALMENNLYKHILSDNGDVGRDSTPHKI